MKSERAANKAKEIGKGVKADSERSLFPLSKNYLQVAPKSSSLTDKRREFSKRVRSDDNVDGHPAKTQRPSTSFDQSEKEIVQSFCGTLEDCEGGFDEETYSSCEAIECCSASF